MVPASHVAVWQCGSPGSATGLDWVRTTVVPSLSLALHLQTPKVRTLADHSDTRTAAGLVLLFSCREVPGLCVICVGLRSHAREFRSEMFGRPSNLVRKYVLPHHQLSRGGIPGAERPPATIIGGLSVRDYTAGVLWLSLFKGHAVSETGTHPRSILGHACEARTLSRDGVQTHQNAGRKMDNHRPFYVQHFC